MQFFLPLILAATLTLLFSWNNGSLYLGGLTASGITVYRKAAFLISIAMVLGVLAEGWKMNPGKLAAGNYFPALVTALTIFLVSNVLNVPTSLSNVVVASLVGSSLTLNHGLSILFLVKVILAWILSPFAAMFLYHLIYTLSKSILSRVGLLTIDLVNRLSAYLVSFYSAYSLAANNVGFLLNMTGEAGVYSTLIISAAAFSGVFFLTRRSAFVMGERLVVLSPQRFFTSLLSASIILWILTQLGIPGSFTQTFLGGMVGAVASSPLAMINSRLVKRFVIAWVATTLASVPAGYGLTLLLGV